MSDRLQVKRDTAAGWTSANTVLADGELGFERDTNLLKVGNGSTPWNSLPYMLYPAPMGTAGENLGGHRVIVFTSGLLTYASASNILHLNQVVGLTTSASSIGTPVYYTTGGIVTEPSWTWGTTTPIYLGDNGVLTQTPSNITGFTQIIGVALSSTSILLSLKTPIKIGL